MQSQEEIDSLLGKLMGIEALSRVRSRLREINSEDSKRLRVKAKRELGIVRNYIRDYHQHPHPPGDIKFKRIEDINEKSYSRMRQFLLTSKDFYNKQKGENLSLEEFLS